MHLSEIDDYKLELNLLIHKCQDKLSFYEKEHLQHNEIIRRFDEVIAEKTSRQTFAIYQASVEKTYL